MSDLSTVPSILLWIAGLAISLGFAAFGLISIRERERRAAIIAFVLAGVVSLPFLAAAALPSSAQTGLLRALTAVSAAALVIWFLPIGSSTVESGRPHNRVDERDIMFARARLVPGSKDFDTYYAMRPANREGDDRTRLLPGLLSPEAPLAEPVAFGSAKASFTVTEALRHEVDGLVAPGQLERSAAEMTVTESPSKVACAGPSMRTVAFVFGMRSVPIADVA